MSVDILLAGLYILGCYAIPVFLLFLMNKEKVND